MYFKYFIIRKYRCSFTLTSLVTATELVNCIFLLWSGSILIFFLPEKKEVRKSRKFKKKGEKREKKKNQSVQ